ncbi:MAG: hypothetical protein RLZZ252_1267 [Bacteroidota bacterium]|jgi:predicted nucleic acid-binding protein
MIKMIGNLARKSRTLRYWHKWLNVHSNAYVGWKTFAKREKKEIDKLVATQKKGHRILLATSLGSELVASRLEKVLSLALMLRGHHAEFVLCDGILPACQNCTFAWYRDRLERLANSGPKDYCRVCFDPAARAMRDAGLNVNAYSDFLSDTDLKNIEQVVSAANKSLMKTYVDGGVAVGEHALAGALRFFAKAELESEEYGERILRNYFRAALITTQVFKNLFRERGIDVVVVHHGIYVPQGIIASVAREMGIRVVAWNVAYRKERFLFSHGDTYHHTLMDEPTSIWEHIPWTNERLNALNSYLHSRWRGKEDWITFQLENPAVEEDKIRSRLNLDPKKTCVAMLTNVLWDAQIHYPTNAFASMIDWLVETVEYFGRRPDLQLVIRIHPAEINGRVPSRQLVVDLVASRFPKLPHNVRLIPPDSNISTYAVIALSNAALIYGTKMGVELTSKGIPVIVAGEAWIRNKGLTFDAINRDDYFQLLDKLPFKEGLSEKIRQRACMYAYHFFFRRMIFLRSLRSVPGWPPFDMNIANLKDLQVGVDPGLDVICDGITKGLPFVYDEPELNMH